MVYNGTLENLHLRLVTMFSDEVLARGYIKPPKSQVWSSGTVFSGLMICDPRLII